MLSGEKILITGPAGNIAFPIAKALARDNEVWGIARFSKPAQREEVEALGVTTRQVDLYEADFGDLPRDFTYVLHLAVAFEESYDRAIRTNGEGTGFLFDHCRSAKAALLMSSSSVYRPHPDPFHHYREDGPLGDPLNTGFSSYPVSKISQEAVARYCARALNLPVVIARMNAAYGPRGGLQASHADAIVAGRPVVTRHETCAYTPIFDDDIVDQVEALLDAARAPATIVNWGGDEVVTVQEWTAYMGELLGLPVQVEVKRTPGASTGNVSDPQRRREITGPTKVTWKDGMRRLLEGRYPDRVLKA
jgi:nucleoside-diphosphate-sugar epimerase